VTPLVARKMGSRSARFISLQDFQVFVSILAGLLTANRAANVDPVMALKRE